MAPESILLTDLYQLTMLQAYHQHGMNDVAVFEFFVRKLPTIIDAEYDNEASLVELPEWISRIDTQFGRGGLRYFAGHDLDASTRASLTSLGARPAPAEYLEQHDSGTLLWFSSAASGLPAVLGSRGLGARLMFFPGPDAAQHPSWALADWVIAGPWPEAVKQLHSDLWKPALA